MKESIDCPKLVEQSKKVQKGQHWLVELLVFVTVYIIAAFGEMLILLPGELVRGYGTAVGGVGADCGFGCLRGVKAFFRNCHASGGRLILQEVPEAQL